MALSRRKLRGRYDFPREMGCNKWKLNRHLKGEYIKIMYKLKAGLSDRLILAASSVRALGREVDRQSFQVTV